MYKKANFMGSERKSILMIYDKYPELHSKWDKSFWGEDIIYK